MVCLQETITIKVNVYKYKNKCVSETVQKILFDLCNSNIHHHPDTLSKSQLKFTKQKMNLDICINKKCETYNQHFYNTKCHVVH